MKYSFVTAMISTICLQMAINSSENVCPHQGVVCAPDWCCSIYGWCGQGPDYCGTGNTMFPISTTTTTTTSSSSQCATDEFKCDNSKCIPNSWICDSIKDCNDNADEGNCTATTTTTTTSPPVECENDEFKCDNKCIPNDWLCDSINDCYDNSDEINCGTTPTNASKGSTLNPTVYPTIKQTVNCESNQFKCDNKCIPSSWICDSIKDCNDYSDEINCTTTTTTTTSHTQCESDEFKCDNNQCIPNSWTCDSYDDCGDNSDESKCDNQKTNVNYTRSNRIKSLKCDGITYNLFGFIIQEPAGVCNEKDGSMLRCGSDGNIRAVMYENSDCSGSIIKQIDSYENALLSQGAINTSVTCCSGNQCRYGIIKRYNSTECINDDQYSDVNMHFSFDSEFNFGKVVGGCDGISGAIMNKFVSCSDGKLTHNEYMYSESCDGKNVTTNIMSTGQCMDGNKIEILCGTAVDTCDDEQQNTFTVTIIICGGGVCFGILICVIVCCIKKKKNRNKLLKLVEFTSPVIKMEGMVQTIA